MPAEECADAGGDQVAGFSAGRFAIRGGLGDDLGLRRGRVKENELIGREVEEVRKIHASRHAAVEFGKEHPAILEAAEDTDEGRNAGERKSDLGLGRGSKGGMCAWRQVELDEEIGVFALEMEPVFESHFPRG